VRYGKELVMSKEKLTRLLAKGATFLLRPGTPVRRLNLPKACEDQARKEFLKLLNPSPTLVIVGRYARGRQSERP
jgi:hypothetical protein